MTERILALLLLAAACGDDSTAATVDPAPAADPAPPPAPPPAAAAAPGPADPNEACARVIVVAWQGAPHAADTVTRSEDEARARAEQIRARIDGGEDFATVARAESDAASTGPRGGLMGTYTRDEWPAIHAPIADAVFSLQVGQLGDVVRASYGYVVAQRCAVEKVHTRHVLIRYQGAHNAGDVDRPQDAARQLAHQIHGMVTAPGADFEQIARDRSEDGSAERGGDVGTVGRGRLEPEYEEAAFALAPGQISDVVETRVGYHVIQRVD